MTLEDEMWQKNIDRGFALLAENMDINVCNETLADCYLNSWETRIRQTEWGYTIYARPTTEKRKQISQLNSQLNSRKQKAIADLERRGYTLECNVANVHLERAADILAGEGKDIRILPDGDSLALYTKRKFY